MLYNKHRHIIVALLIYIILTIIMTFPLILKINHSIPGFFSTDEPSIWYFWWLKHSFKYHLDSKFSNLVAYPFGTDMSMIEQMYPLAISLKKALAYICNPFLAYNIDIILIPFIFSGLFTYLLIRHLTKNSLAAIFSGIVYSFCPYHFVRAWQHTGLSHIEWFPLLLLGLVKLNEHKNFKLSFFVIATIVTIFLFDLYYAYFAVVMLMVFIACKMAWKEGRKKVALTNLILSSTLGLAISFIILLPVAAQILFTQNRPSEGLNAVARPFHDLFTQSAKPLSYFLPSTEHPIFGNFTEQFIGSPLYGVSYTEHTLYLGWIPLILAFVAFRRWRRNRKLIAHSSELIGNEKEQFYIGFFVWLAIVAWLFSQPPYFAFPYFKIYMPSFFMYKIVAMFRAYCRFGIVVMFAVSVLAGFGLKFILERLKNYKTKMMVTSLVCGLVLFEFLNFPPFKIIDLSKHAPVYDWLKAQKDDFVIAEYPLDVESPYEYYRFCQTVHGKKIIDGTNPGTFGNNIAKSIWKLSEQRTARVLNWLKVKYVIVHLNAYGESNDMKVVNELGKIKMKKLPGLKFIKKFDDVDVYEVTVTPRGPCANE